MKSRNTTTNPERAGSECSRIDSACAGCQVVDKEKGVTVGNEAYSQLYAKEAENYFFYYQRENEAVNYSI